MVERLVICLSCSTKRGVAKALRAAKAPQGEGSLFCKDIVHVICNVLSSNVNQTVESHFDFEDELVQDRHSEMAFAQPLEDHNENGQK